MGLKRTATHVLLSGTALLMGAVGLTAGDKPAPADTRTKVQKKAATAACAQGFDAGMKQQSIDPARLMVMDFDSAVSEGKTLCTANVAAGKYGRVAHSYFLPDAQTPGLK